MKRSGNVGLVVMGGAAFAATFAGGMAYLAWQKPSHAGTQATYATQPQPAQSCQTQPGSTQTCEPARRGFAYYFFPSGWGWGSSSASARPQQAAFSSGGSRGYSSTSGYSPTTGGGVERSGFGSTAKGSFRVSAGG